MQNASSNATEVNGISNVTTSSVPHKAQPEGLLSDAIAHAIQTAVEVGILPALVLAGVTMNIINMAVFLRQGLSDRINLCLFSLAIADTGYILLLMIRRLHNLVRIFDPPFGQYWKFRMTSLTPFYVASLTTSNCLTLLISLERCLLVISPLKAKAMLSTRHMTVIIFMTFCTCLSCLSVYCIKFDVITVIDPETNVITYKPVISQFFSDNADIIEYLFNIFTTVVPSIACVGVIAATCIIAVRLRHMAVWREKSAHITISLDQKEASMTRMLFAICIMYTVCSIPSVIRPVLVLLLPDLGPGGKFQNTFFTIMSFVHLTAVVNSSFNFVIYYLMSSRFRETLKEMFDRLRSHT